MRGPAPARARLNPESDRSRSDLSLELGVSPLPSLSRDLNRLRNFTLGLPAEVQASLSDEMRGLLGFRLWSSYGATDDYDVEFARPGYESAP